VIPGSLSQLEPGGADAVIIADFPCDWAAARQATLLAECCRVLRPGGYIVFCAGNASWYRRWAGRGRETSAGRPPALDVRTIRRQLVRAGFAEVRAYLGDGNPTALKAIIPFNSGQPAPGRAAQGTLGCTQGHPLDPHPPGTRLAVLPVFTGVCLQMNIELRDLLRQAGLPEADDPGLWRRSIMVHVTGLLPPPRDHVGTSGEAGFHLLLLDERGRALHRVKCRSATDQGFERECETLVALGGDPELIGLVPEVRTAASPRLRMHVSRQLPGESYLTTMRKQDVGEWQRTVEQVLALVDLVGERAKQVVPWLRSTRPELHLGEALADRFGQLERQGVDTHTLKALRTALEGSSCRLTPSTATCGPTTCSGMRMDAGASSTSRPSARCGFRSTTPSTWPGRREIEPGRVARSRRRTTGL
jgi:hypothetical protein